MEKCELCKKKVLRPKEGRWCIDCWKKQPKTVKPKRNREWEIKTRDLNRYLRSLTYEEFKEWERNLTQ